MAPLFTIGIASYNYAKYITKELDAIRRQTFKDYEVLISDDHSTDNSVEVIKKYMLDYPEMNIRLIESAENRGLVENKNCLIENCIGKYLMICDADDWMSDDCLSLMADVIEKDDPDRVIGEVAHIDEEGRIIQVEEPPYYQTKWGWNIHHGSVCRTSILREHGIKIYWEIDDVYYTVEIAKYCKKISYIREVVYYWLVHLDSEGRKNSFFSVEQIVQRHMNVLEFFQNTIQFIEKGQDNYTEQDVEELRLVKMKMYYFAILFIAQNLRLNEKYLFYRNLHTKMLSLDQNYLRNKYLFFTREKRLRPYALCAIKICVILEKLRIMKLGIFGYHIISKIKYFDQ